MKKYITIIGMLICLCLSACNKNYPDTLQPDSDSSSDISVNDSDNSLHVSENDPSDPATHSLYFNSLDDFKKVLSEETKLNAVLSEAGVKSKGINKVKILVEKLRSHNNIFPYLNGKVIEFRNKEGFQNITLFSEELYDLPCIFYYPYVPTGENFYIKITYVPDHILEMQKNPTASEVIKILSPNSPNIDNLGKLYKIIDNRTIKLRNKEVTALVYEYKNDARNSIKFVYNELLVEVRCDPEVWNEDWFSGLSFEGFNT